MLMTVKPKLIVDELSAVTNASGFASQANDRSGNGLHFTQGTSGARPEILPAELTGGRVLRFDGSNDFMACSVSGALDLYRNTGAGWVFSVYKKRGTDGAAQDKTLFRSQNNIGATRFALQVGSSLSGANRPELGVRRLDGDSFSTLGATAAHSGAWVMVLATQNWSTRAGSLYIDGALDASNSTLTSAGATSNTASNSGLVLGIDLASGGTRFADVDLAALVAGSGSLPTMGEIDKLFGCYAWRRGLESNLPPGHPYKDSPP